MSKKSKKEIIITNKGNIIEASLCLCVLVMVEKQNVSPGFVKKFSGKAISIIKVNIGRLLMRDSVNLQTAS